MRSVAFILASDLFAGCKKDEGVARTFTGNGKTVSVAGPGVHDAKGDERIAVVGDTKGGAVIAGNQDDSKTVFRSDPGVAKTDCAEEKAVSETRSTSQLERNTVDPVHSSNLGILKKPGPGPLPLGFGFE
jgi:hypothetical protein